MDSPAHGPREEASPVNRGVLIVVAAFTGFVFLGMLPETVRLLLGITRAVDGLDLFVFYNALFGVAFVQLLTRVIRREFAWPTGWPLVANVLDSFARGWGIGLVVLSASELADALRNFGTRSANGSLLADAFFFAVVTLVLAAPAMAALWLARRVA